MRRKAIQFHRLALIFVLVLTGMHGMAEAEIAMRLTAHHDLTLSLFPEKSELEGWDRIRIQRLASDAINFLLAPNARIQAVRIDGNDHPYTVDQGRLTLNPDRSASNSTVELSIHYFCRFDDPAPVRPCTDNPGFGVSGRSLVGNLHPARCRLVPSDDRCPRDI